MAGIGLPELLIVLVIIVVVFGVGRLPEVGGAIGRSIREFKSSLQPDDKVDELEDTVDKV